MLEERSSNVDTVEWQAGGVETDACSESSNHSALVSGDEVPCDEVVESCNESLFSHDDVVSGLSERSELNSDDSDLGSEPLYHPPATVGMPLFPESQISSADFNVTFMSLVQRLTPSNIYCITDSK